MIRRRTLLSALTAAAIVPARASAEALTLRMGVGAEGSGFRIYAATLIDALKGVDPTLEIKSETTKGSNQNIRQMQAGELDLGLVSSEVVHDLFTAGGDALPLKIVTVTSSTPGMFCVRADSRYRSIAELQGRPVVWGPRGSGAAVQARYVMDGIGLDIDRDFEAIYPDSFTDGAPLVLDGRAAALWGIGLRWPGFVEIASRPIGGRFVVPTAEEIVRIRSKHPFLEKLTVPAGLYPGQYEALDTVGSWSFIMARPDLADSVGRRLAIALYKVERSGLPARQLAQTTVRNTLAAIKSVDDLQAGILAYYRDIKLVK